MLLKATFCFVRGISAENLAATVRQLSTESLVLCSWKLPKTNIHTFIAQEMLGMLVSVLCSRDNNRVEADKGTRSLLKQKQSGTEKNTYSI